MRNLLALTVREWKAFWYSPIAYVVGGFFFLLQGMVFWLLVAALNNPVADASWTIGQAFFGTFFFWMSVLVMAPLLTMRCFSEEKRTGTIEVLLSAPVTDWQVVGAKFFGAWLSYSALWAGTMVYFLMIRFYAVIDWGPLATGYLGTVLMGAALISVGILASSLTRNQVIAAGMGFVLMLLLFFIGFLESFVTSPDSRQIVQYLSLLEHFRDFSRGILDTRPIVFYLSVSAIALFVTIRAIGNPRWRA